MFVHSILALQLDSPSPYPPSKCYVPVPPESLGLEADVWCELVRDFDTLFSLVAGRPAAMDEARTLGRQARFHTRPRTRELLSA
ncbi:MAG: hypothetical protein R3C09_25220 [Pirellulaceae bacterium]